MKVSASKYAQCLYFSSNAVARKMEKLANESWKKVDLSPSHAYLLMLVLDEPGIQPSALVGQLQLAASTITRLVEKLEEKKLLQRTTEGKVTNIYPTPKAKALIPALNECRDHFDQSCATLLGKEEGIRLAGNFTKFADKIPG